MPTYQYRGRNQRGEAVSGAIEAVSPEAVANQLFNSGVTPIDITLGRAAGDMFAGLKALFKGGRVEIVDLVLFSRQMYTLLKAGVPIMQALRGLRDSTHNPALAKVIGEIGDALDSGLDLTGALRRHPKVFSSLYLSMIQVGETTGGLPEAFLQMAAYLEQEKDTRDRVTAASRYPTFVLLAIVIAMFIINIFVIPAFAHLYSGFHIQLPLATRILIATSRFSVAYWPAMLAALVAAALGVRAYVRTDAGRYRWHRWRLHLPVVGKILFQAALARFTRALSVTVRAGVPLVQGLTVVSRAVDNDFISERVVQIRDAVERGETVTRAAAATGLFPALVVQMISVGEDTGAIDELMLNVAEYYEREVDYGIKHLSDALEPLLIVVMGVLVLILALGVFLPMWDIVKIARTG